MSKCVIMQTVRYKKITEKVGLSFPDGSTIWGNSNAVVLQELKYVFPNAEKINRGGQVC